MSRVRLAPVHRIISAAVPSLGLAAIIAFVVSVHMSAPHGLASTETCPLAACPSEVSQGATAPPSVAASEPEVRWVSARELPMRASIESAETVWRRALLDGPSVIEASPPLGPWQRIMLGRFLAIDEIVMAEAERHGNDPLWLFLALASESALDPLAQGPELGDRGLGQVSFASEATAREWARNPSSPYYVPDFNVRASIWDPRTNIVLASVVMRSIYAMPDVTSSEQAYARYTHGLRAVQDDRIASTSMIRVGRALGYTDQMRLYFALAAHPTPPTRDVSAIYNDPLVVEMLALDARVPDGLPMYLALRDLYLTHALTTPMSEWALALQLSEALTYERLAREAWGLRDPVAVRSIRDALDAALPRFDATHDRGLIRFVHSTLREAQDILNREGIAYR